MIKAIFTKDFFVDDTTQRTYRAGEVINMTAESFNYFFKNGVIQEHKKEEKALENKPKTEENPIQKHKK